MCSGTFEGSRGGAEARRSGGELHQVPQVAVEILEHGDVGVRLLGGRADEADAAGAVGFVVAVEIVRLQKQKDAPARLVTDEGLLLRRGGAGEEEGGGGGARAGRRDEHPPFVLLGLVLMGDEGEAELLLEPGDRLSWSRAMSDGVGVAQSC